MNTGFSAHKRNEYLRKDGTFVSATRVIGHCRSKSKSYEYWEGQFANGTIPNWPHKREKMKDWSREDLQNVLRAFEKVPQEIWEKARLYPATQSVTPNNPATSAEGIIVLYDNAFTNLAVLSRYLVHELGHQKYDKLSFTDSESYLKAAEWKNVVKPSMGTNMQLMRSKTIAPDSDIGPDEDFANNLEYFIYEPLKLKFKIPAVYEWLRKRYGDKVRAKD